MKEAVAESEISALQFKVFRHADGDDLEITEYTGLTEVSQQGLQKVDEAGIGEGADVRVVLDVPGFSITYAWFKSGFPLPRHAHHAHCAYYIIAGSLRLGTETLGKGDGFFVPAETPYTYVPGPEGVEVLEFRQEGCHDFHLLANNAAFWDKALTAVQGNRARWQAEARPKA